MSCYRKFVNGVVLVEALLVSTISVLLTGREAPTPGIMACDS
jgi:hypothetical protein